MDWLRAKLYSNSHNQVLTKHGEATLSYITKQSINKAIEEVKDALSFTFKEDILCLFSSSSHHISCLILSSAATLYSPSV